MQITRYIVLLSAYAATSVGDTGPETDQRKVGLNKIYGIENVFISQLDKEFFERQQTL